MKRTMAAVYGLLWTVVAQAALPVCDPNGNTYSRVCDGTYQQTMSQIGGFFAGVWSGITHAASYIMSIF